MIKLHPVVLSVTLPAYGPCPTIVTAATLNVYVVPVIVRVKLVLNGKSQVNYQVLCTLCHNSIGFRGWQP